MHIFHSFPLWHFPLQPSFSAVWCLSVLFSLYIFFFFLDEIWLWSTFNSYIYFDDVLCDDKHNECNFCAPHNLARLFVFAFEQNFKFLASLWLFFSFEDENIDKDHFPQRKMFLAIYL